MYLFFKKCVLLLFIAFPVFSQNQTPASLEAPLQVREQGQITGDPFWRQALGGAVMSLPSVQVQSAVVALDGGNIRAYSTIGTPLWSYSARGRISPYVTRSREGTSYISRTNGIFIAVNRAGREIWRRQLSAPLSAKVVIGWDSRLFIPTEGKMYCFTASGTQLWTRTFEAPYSIAPMLDRNGGVILSLSNNEVYRVDPFGNAHVWMLSNTPAALLSIEQQQVVVLYIDGTIEVLGLHEDWYMSALGETHLSVLPRLPARPLAAAAYENNIAITMNNGAVALLSMDERRIIWTADSHIREIINNRSVPATEVEMLFDERGIYVLNKDGATAFSHNGIRLWFKFLQNAAAIPAFGNDGVLYSGGIDWILYAYRIEDRILPERISIYGPVPENIYGLGRPRPIYRPIFPYSENETRVKLQQIGSAINAGMIGGNEPEWKSFLLTLSAGEEPLLLRIAALDLLGRIGSQETIPHLVNIFRNDNEPLIRVSAVNAIGRIGVDPQGIAIQSFLHSITQGTRDEQVLTAIASATGTLCRFSGPPLSEIGVRILTLLTATDQPPAARRQANRELASL